MFITIASHRAARRALPLTLVALAACQDTVAPRAAQQAFAGTPSRAATVSEPADGPWARIVAGRSGPGAEYELHIPREWNGGAVFYAHGFRDAAEPVVMRDQDAFHAIRDALGAQGYAVAASSYSRNGFAVKDGTQRTHQLRGLLAAHLPGQPLRSFLLGHSLGAAVALDLTERFPAQYDGALLMCGMVGGTLPQTQYLGHVRALFDHYFPGRVPGSVTGVPDGLVVTPAMVFGAIPSNPLGLLAIGSTAQTPLPFVGRAQDLATPGSPAAVTLATSLYVAVSFHARGVNDITALTHGQTPFGNDETVYALGTPLAPPSLLAPLVDGANAHVTRVRMSPAARAYLTHNFTPSGDLRVPVVTLHNRWDPAVPLFHETLLRETVDAAGAGALLFQRTFDAYGHCGISAAQALAGFDELTRWVSTGQRPTP